MASQSPQRRAVLSEIERSSVVAKEQLLAEYEARGSPLLKSISSEVVCGSPLRDLIPDIARSPARHNPRHDQLSVDFGDLSDSAIDRCLTTLAALGMPLSNAFKAIQAVCKLVGVQATNMPVSDIREMSDLERRVLYKIRLINKNAREASYDPLDDDLPSRFPSGTRNVCAPSSLRVSVEQSNECSSPEDNEISEVTASENGSDTMSASSGPLGNVAALPAEDVAAVEYETNKKLFRQLSRKLGFLLGQSDVAVVAISNALDTVMGSNTAMAAPTDRLVAYMNLAEEELCLRYAYLQDAAGVSFLLDEDDNVVALDRRTEYDLLNMEWYNALFRFLDEQDVQNYVLPKSVRGEHRTLQYFYDQAVVVDANVGEKRPRDAAVNLFPADLLSHNRVLSPIASTPRATPLGFGTDSAWDAVPGVFDKSDMQQTPLGGEGGLSDSRTSSVLDLLTPSHMKTPTFAEAMMYDFGADNNWEDEMQTKELQEYYKAVGTVLKRALQQGDVAVLEVTPCEDGTKEVRYVNLAEPNLVFRYVWLDVPAFPGAEPALLQDSKGNIQKDSNNSDFDIHDPQWYADMFHLLDDDDLVYMKKKLVDVPQHMEDDAKMQELGVLFERATESPRKLTFSAQRKMVKGPEDDTDAEEDSKSTLKRRETIRDYSKTRCIKELLEIFSLPDAVFVTKATMASQLCRQLQAAGSSSPHEVNLNRSFGSASDLKGNFYIQYPDRMDVCKIVRARKEIVDVILGLECDRAEDREEIKMLLYEEIIKCICSKDNSLRLRCALQSYIGAFSKFKVEEVVMKLPTFNVDVNYEKRTIRVRRMYMDVRNFAPAFAQLVPDFLKKTERLLPMLDPASSDVEEIELQDFFSTSHD